MAAGSGGHTAWTRRGAALLSERHKQLLSNVAAGDLAAAWEQVRSLDEVTRARLPGVAAAEVRDVLVKGVAEVDVMMGMPRSLASASDANASHPTHTTGHHMVMKTRMRLISSTSTSLPAEVDGVWSNFVVVPGGDMEEALRASHDALPVHGVMLRGVGFVIGPHSVECVASYWPHIHYSRRRTC